MAFLIDGYNLLHATGIFGRDGPGSLERSRLALLDFLAEALGPRDSRRTTVVFDGKNSPPGLASVTEHRGLRVRYSRRDEEADDLLEALIASEPAPRELTVVSSDHRVQRAARRRRAIMVDSDDWYRELRQRRPAASASQTAEKPESTPADATPLDDLLDQARRLLDEALGKRDDQLPLPPDN